MHAVIIPMTRLLATGDFAMLLSMLTGLVMYNLGPMAISPIPSLSPQTTSASVQLFGAPHERFLVKVSVAVYLGMGMRIGCIGSESPLMASGGELCAGHHGVQPARR
jgi:hypothetical protein